MPTYCQCCGKVRSTRSRLYEAVAAAGDAGVSTNEMAGLLGMDAVAAQRAIERVVADGLIERGAYRPGRGRPLVLRGAVARGNATEQGRPATPAN